MKTGEGVLAEEAFAAPTCVLEPPDGVAAEDLLNGFKRGEAAERPTDQERGPSRSMDAAYQRAAADRIAKSGLAMSDDEADAALEEFLLDYRAGKTESVPTSLRDLLNDAAEARTNSPGASNGQSGKAN